MGAREADGQENLGKSVSDPSRVLRESTDGFHYRVLERNVALGVLLDSDETDLFGWANTNFVGV